jgi:hypothetical protein
MMHPLKTMPSMNTSAGNVLTFARNWIALSNAWLPWAPVSETVDILNLARATAILREHHFTSIHVSNGEEGACT